MSASNPPLFFPDSSGKLKLLTGILIVSETVGVERNVNCKRLATRSVWNSCCAEARSGCNALCQSFANVEGKVHWSKKEKKGSHKLQRYHCWLRLLRSIGVKRDDLWQTWGAFTPQSAGQQFKAGKLLSAEDSGCWEILMPSSKLCSVSFSALSTCILLLPWIVL